MILLVEDDVIIRCDLASVLRNAGYEVMEASDGNGALALIEKSPPDLVITDVRMPAESGLVLAVHIHVKWPDKPVILMSGVVSEDAGKYISQGVAEFIHKPVDPTALHEMVKRLFPDPLPGRSIVWRKAYDSDVWHHCSNCATWPARNYDERDIIPADSQVCSECKYKRSV